MGAEQVGCLEDPGADTGDWINFEQKSEPFIVAGEQNKQEREQNRSNN